MLADLVVHPLWVHSRTRGFYTKCKRAPAHYGNANSYIAILLAVTVCLVEFQL